MEGTLQLPSLRKIMRYAQARSRETAAEAEVVESHYDDKSIQSQEFNDAKSRGYFAGGSSKFRLHQQENDSTQRDGAAE